MKAVLRLLSACFAMVPLQKWVSLAGLLLLAAALASHAFGRHNGTFGFALLGATLLALVPTFVGGVALRLGSTPSVLHLKPHGRIRMIAAATLTIMLLTALVALPLFLDHWLELQRPGRRSIDPWQALAIIWTGMVMTWIALFTFSQSLFTFSLVGLLPLLGMGVARVTTPLQPHPLWWFAAGTLAWAMFTLWYLRTASVTRPALSVSAQSTDGVGMAPLLRLFDAVIPAGTPTRAQAQHFYLFGGPLSMYVLTGVWVALIFVVVNQFVVWFNAPGRPMVGHLNLLAMLPYLGFFLFTQGITTVRRARYLWLRDCQPRAALFALAERLGLRATLTAWTITAAGVLVFALAGDSGKAGELILYVVAHLAFAICLFYGGMAMTHAWALRDVLLAAGLWLWFIVHLYQLQPHRDAEPGTALTMTLAALALAALLRWYAARAWRRIDWRVVLPSPPAARTPA